MRDMMDIPCGVATRARCSEDSQPSDMHLRTRLLIRRFGVRVPGGPHSLSGGSPDGEGPPHARCGPVLTGEREQARAGEDDLHLTLCSNAAV